ncbi:YbjQ family protein [bacterium]|nr:YbjQ family protein [bacterium]
MVAPQNSLPIPAGIVVTTTLNVDGYRIREYRGIVRGAMVREPTIGQNFKAGFQGMFGGKIGAYVTMCEQGRQQSYDTMVAKAKALGANAIVGVQYDSNSFSTDSNQFATEVVCYGTAVVIEPAR